MTELIAILEKQNFDDVASTEQAVMDWIDSNGYHKGNLMNATRLTVVGECKGPGMFDITKILGKQETIARIKRGIDTIKPEPAQ